MEVRAYVTEPQLSRSPPRAGRARVTSTPAEASGRPSPASVSWISSQAEFTPTPIQTRDERADWSTRSRSASRTTAALLKIGMPVDVQFLAAQAAR